MNVGLGLEFARSWTQVVIVRLFLPRRYLKDIHLDGSDDMSLFLSFLLFAYARSMTSHS